MLNDKIPKVLSLLNERQQRLYLAMEADDIGHGGELLYHGLPVFHVRQLSEGKKSIESQFQF